MTSDAHTAEFYHGPSAAALEADLLCIECGADASHDVKRLKTTSTTMTTMTSTTTVETTVVSAAAPSVPGRVVGGGKLRESFVCPPFSVLDAGQNSWQQRKREWLALGIDSGKGRDDCLLGAGLVALTPGLSGTSVFDPVSSCHTPVPNLDKP